MRMFVDDNALSYMLAKMQDNTLNSSEYIDASIVFVDICGFTSLSENNEPRNILSLLQTYFDFIVQIILNNNGRIDKFIGDAVFVFFGDPESNGEIEDALNCVEMALRMRERVNELQNYWRKQGVPKEMQIRMGIATGYCTVGNFGSEQRLDYTALGRPVNLAARLEGLADPNAILIDQNTYNLIHDQVSCDHVCLLYTSPSPRD